MSRGRLNAVQWNAYPHAAEMSPVDQAVLSCLADSENDATGLCCPSIIDICQMTHLSETAVTDALKYLRQFPDVLTWEHRLSRQGHKKSFYAFQFPKVERVDGGDLGCRRRIQRFRRRNASAGEFGSCSVTRSCPAPSHGAGCTAGGSDNAPPCGVTPLRQTEVDNNATIANQESNTNMPVDAGIPTLDEVIAWGRSAIDREFLEAKYKRVSEAGWKDSKGNRIANWRSYFKTVSDREGGSIRMAHNRRLDQMSESERADWRGMREGKALEVFAKNHGRKLVPGDWHKWPDPFELREFKDAYAELDAAVDRGEVDVFYRSRYCVV